MQVVDSKHDHYLARFAEPFQIVSVHFKIDTSSLPQVVEKRRRPWPTHRRFHVYFTPTSAFWLSLPSRTLCEAGFSTQTSFPASQPRIVPAPVKRTRRATPPAP